MVYVREVQDWGPEVRWVGNKLRGADTWQQANTALRWLRAGQRRRWGALNA